MKHEAFSAKLSLRVPGFRACLQASSLSRSSLANVLANVDCSCSERILLVGLHDHPKSLFPFQCSQHRDGTAMGILCEPLCSQKGIHSLACETLHLGKEAVFSAHWEATRLVFKASRYSLRSSLRCTKMEVCRLDKKSSLDIVRSSN